MSDWICGSCSNRLCTSCGNCHWCGISTCPERKTANKLQQFIRTICLTILSNIPPDYSTGERSVVVVWDPEKTHYCPFCNVVAMHFDGLSWHCPWCSAEFQSVPITDPHLVARRHRHTEQLPTGDLMRKALRTGEISMHGNELRWVDTDERVNTREIPQIRSHERTPDEDF